MKTVLFRFALPLVLALAPFAAQADEAPAPAGDAAAPADDAGKAAAKKAVQEYLDAVKAKKWDVAKKLTHPKTLEKIEDIKKRTKAEHHPMAPWGRLKEEYMTEFQLSDPLTTARDSFVVPSTETRFSVEDKGSEEGVKSQYLVIPLGGKYYVTDRRDRPRDDENLFPPTTLEAAYKGYFEGEYVAPAPPAKKGKK